MHALLADDELASRVERDWSAVRLRQMCVCPSKAMNKVGCQAIDEPLDSW